ncbi:hypothetical protein [Falsiroseomonas sp.]|jgi:hypothetical protein|uniref:hypothetical protein n=1 Tax=Falsiroseomonas sp. TaxID=2870721 RepID=UPI003F6F38A9
MAKKEALGESVVDEREMLRIEAKSVRPAIGAQTVGAFAPEHLGFRRSEAARMCHWTLGDLGCGGALLALCRQDQREPASTARPPKTEPP